MRAVQQIQAMLTELTLDSNIKRPEAAREYAGVLTRVTPIARPTHHGSFSHYPDNDEDSCEEEEVYFEYFGGSKYNFHCLYSLGGKNLYSYRAIYGGRYDNIVFEDRY